MDIERINPELRPTFARIPAIPFHNRALLKLAAIAMKLRKKPRSVRGIEISEHATASNHVRVYHPAEGHSGAGLLWIHGGGYVLGAPQINDELCARYAEELKLTVVSAGYRLAPKHPFPAGLDDCRNAWQWLLDNAGELGVDTARLVISGESAGGGLAAALVQRVHDEGGVQPAAQALLCPMLDDRTAAREELDAIAHKMWNNRNNRGGWRYYLGRDPGGPETPPYAVPARRESLVGLPRAWVGVGDIDLFHEENRSYAERLREAGVPCEFRDYPGAPHGFELIVPDAPVSRQFWADNDAFLRDVLGLQPASAKQ